MFEEALDSHGQTVRTRVVGPLGKKLRWYSNVGVSQVDSYELEGKMLREAFEPATLRAPNFGAGRMR